MLCHYCEGIIHKNQKIHRGFDENFCSEYCLSQLFMLNKDVDPNFNNYHKWLNNNLEHKKKYYINKEIKEIKKINENIENIEKKDDKQKNNTTCCISKITFVNYIVFQIFPIYYKL